MIGRPHHVVIDCPDPAALAQFYCELLGLPITFSSADWVVLSVNATTSGFAFQRAPDHQAPERPNPQHPQQFHIDVMVEDPTAAAALVCGIGARALAGDGHVFADPAGHPFCLIRRPDWAAPIGSPVGQARADRGEEQQDESGSDSGPTLHGRAVTAQRQHQPRKSEDDQAHGQQAEDG